MWTQPNQEKEGVVKTIEVSARKGGVGTTSVACLVALGYTTCYPDYEIALVDNSNYNACTAFLGISNHNPHIKNITVVQGDAPDQFSKYQIVVIDAGVTSRVKKDAVTIGVVRNDYLSVKAEVEAKLKLDYRVGLITGTNALTLSDVGNCLNDEITPFPFTSEIARSIDAGLVVNRIEQLSGTDWIKTICKSIETLHS